MAIPKILIVDDSKTIRIQIVDMLPKGTFNVVEAKDGAEGLMLIVQERPNLILLDFFMPRMNGWEVVQKIQADPALKSIPVVMMSGRREDVEKTVPELFNYFEFISKPFQQATLFKAIQTASAKAKNRHLLPVAPPSTAAVAAPTPVPSSSTAAAAIPTREPTTASTTRLADVHPSIPVVIDDVQQLKTEVRQLRAQNAALHSEVEALKQRMHQLAAFVRQRM